MRHEDERMHNTWGSSTNSDTPSPPHWVSAERKLQRLYPACKPDFFGDGMLRRYSIEQRRQMMARIRSRDTYPEKVVRSLLHRMGFRFRLHRKDLPGRPDIVLPRHKKVILIHGCFWHWHRGCRLFRMPKFNKEYWLPKMRGNCRRDKKNYNRLRKLGFKYLVVWECQTRDCEKLAGIVGSFMRKTRAQKITVNHYQIIEAHLPGA